MPGGANTTTSEETAGELIARSLINGTPSATIVNALIEDGIPMNEAINAVAIIKGGIIRRIMWSFFWGIVWIIGSTIVSLVTYAAASSSPEGGYYFMFWGGAVFGVYKCYRALRARHEIRNL